ncbi:UDP-N-acetylglucosamine 2-epimerase (non-hydrolyzing) [Actinoplanes hulinensis]|uniref:UDP-N-acetylglucosamine 2-epimerase (non-hydrolyzing) n=1 Tax=Actinoplanes hulinensis TaxID=1144547 RepID=A0ABS7BBF1_9ACTN|nr:UDP-N-acetylglucosamine 2-epimerase (non-hydrolyzing) [Actinoplanes hulinensis]MBW6438315.1 UDP-N-acetylglucosamine 2-epimerase (non-hydrolyzing) [Actinoplanes hulinensis]
MSRREAHLVGGTHPEAVRLAPVALAIREAGLLEPVLLAAGPHSRMVTEALAAFDLEPDITLQVEPSTDGRTESLTAMIRELDELWSVRTPAAVIVQGDTTTSLAGALAAFWRRIPVVHLGAGRRSGDPGSPFPEEGDRRLAAQVAALHLAPTPLAAMNLLDERIPARDVLITGDTVVDATLAVAGRKPPFENPDVAAARAAGGNRLILVTADRHDRILAAVRELIDRYPDIDVILPGHPDPAVRSRVDTALAGVERVTVTGPLSYPDLSRLLSEAYLLLTDSGGPLEEAPSFGVPALVLRDVTERVESLHAGCAEPVGPDTALIVSEASALLDSRVRRDAMTAGGNPYGDGLAARRTAQATAALLGLAPAPEAMPVTPHIADAILNG